MNDEFRRVAGLVHDAKRYSQLFTGGDRSAVRATYRTLMKAVHPDRAGSDRQDEANDVVAKLARLYEDALLALDNGTFGDPDPLLTLQSTDFRHDCLTKRTRWADMTAMFDGRSIRDDDVVDSVIKIAARPADNDLMAAEADALRMLADAGAEHAMYYPKLLDSLAVADGRRRLRANVLQCLDGFYSLEQVQQRYPNGIHPLDMGWIWRRVLWALGGAHDVGVLHGAVVPSHIMIHPTLHGVVLVDWCYSTMNTGGGYAPLSAIVGRHRDWYDTAVLARSAPTRVHDLAFAARTMRFVMGNQPVPDAISHHLDGIANGTAHGSAYDLLAQFDRILERLGAPYYPRSYRPLNW